MNPERIEIMTEDPRGRVFREPKRPTPSNFVLVVVFVNSNATWTATLLSRPIWKLLRVAPSIVFSRMNQTKLEKSTGVDDHDLGWVPRIERRGRRV